MLGVSKAQVSNTGLFFHRFLGNTNKWICQILEFKKKILDSRGNFLTLSGKFA